MPRKSDARTVRTPTTTAVHRTLGEVTPLQRTVTSNGTPALRVKCPDGQERTILLLKSYWETPLPALFAVPTDPPKRTRARAENVRASVQTDDLADLDARLDDEGAVIAVQDYTAETKRFLLE
jgi:hypothetical protein